MENDDNPKSGSRKWGLVAVGVTGAVAIGLSVISAPFVTPALRKFCLPYVPATNRQVANVVLMCNKHRKMNGIAEKLIDLGSGDGRIVLKAAQNGFDATGVELNLWLVLYSKIAAAMKGLYGQAKFRRKDLWTVDFSLYDKIVIFGVAEMMPSLKEKLAEELRSDSQIVACRFPIPTWTPVDTIEEGIDSVWVYNSRNIPKFVSR